MSQFQWERIKDSIAVKGSRRQENFRRVILQKTVRVICWVLGMLNVVKVGQLNVLCFM